MVLDDLVYVVQYCVNYLFNGLYGGSYRKYKAKCNLLCQEDKILPFIKELQATWGVKDFEYAVKMPTVKNCFKEFDYNFRCCCDMLIMDLFGEDILDLGCDLYKKVKENKPAEGEDYSYESAVMASLADCYNLFSAEAWENMVYLIISTIEEDEEDEDVIEIVI